MFVTFFFDGPSGSTLAAGSALFTKSDDIQMNQVRSNCGFISPGRPFKWINFFPVALQMAKPYVEKTKLQALALPETNIKEPQQIDWSYMKFQLCFDKEY